MTDKIKLDRLKIYLGIKFLEGNGPVIQSKVPHGVNTVAEEVKWVFWTVGYLLFLTSA